MPACTRSAVSMFTDFFASDDIEATARRMGFVKRAAKITGKLFLALVPCGAWHAANTTLAPLAAKGAPWDQPVDVSPDAMHQRLTPKALACLQDMIRQALANVQTLERGWADGLFPCFPPGDIADSPGFALPEALPKTCPGSGGSAANAGAKIQAVWADKRRVFGPFALTPWNLPDQRDVDTGSALAPQGMLWLCA